MAYKNPDDPRKNSSRLAWYYAHREHSIAQMRRYREELKDACYSAYGGYICTCCEETERSFLCLDHVNNDGYKHRKEMRSRGGVAIYYWIRKNNFPTGLFQVLCYNCNQSKRLNNGVCAHKGNKMSHSFEQSGPGDSIMEMRRPEGHAHLDQKHDKGMRSPMLSQLPMDAGLASPETSAQSGSGHGDSGYTGGGQ